METHLPSESRASAEAKPAPHGAQPAKKSRETGVVLKMEAIIPARVSAISPLVDAVMKAVRQHTTSKEMEIETALREALANAIKHGCACDPSKSVQCSVSIENDRSVRIVVRDPGRGFKAKSLPNPTQGDGLYRSHGRGIYLINSLMDEVHFERDGAEIHMCSRL